jgi:hypothetical protein
MVSVNCSIKSIKDNSSQPKTHFGDQLMAELEDYVISLGACSIGYTRLPAQWVFQNKGALYPNVIVLGDENGPGGY